MKYAGSVLTACAALLDFAGAAFAQDHSGDNMSGSMELPQACQVGEAPSMAGMEAMHSGMETATEHGKAMMQGMMETEAAMMRGMMAEDADVAFACAMIPHHQGAIDMAEVQLEHGNSEEMNELARKIINDQKREIEQLTTWINAQAQ